MGRYRFPLILSVAAAIITFMACSTFLQDDNSEAFAPVDLTPAEKAWLKEHPVIRLAPDPDFPPIEFLNDHGEYDGIAADYIRLLEKKLPVRFEIVRLNNWSEVLEQIKTKKIDMLGAVTPTPDRLSYLNFTRAYVEFPAVVLVRDSSTDFPTLSQLKGKRVAVVANYADHEHMIRAYPHIPLEIMPDISSGLRQVSFGKVDAMVLNLASASYFIQKDGITNLQVTEDTDFIFDLSFGCRKDWPILASILEKAMATINRTEKQEISNRWISLGDSSWHPSPLEIISSIAVLLSLGMFAILHWNRTLKKQVAERTAELETELEERLQVEKEKAKLQQAIDKAKKMEALGMLAGGVAHDLNNILTGTIGFSEIAIQKSGDNPDLQRYLKEIKNSGQRAAAVVADMLTISRDSASDRNTINPNTLIKEYLDSAEHETLIEEFPEITFSTDLDNETPNISCSEMQIKKCIMNLMRNAAEAVRAGTVTISTAGIKSEPPSYLQEQTGEKFYSVISVTDNGPGISPEDIDHIFEPFYSRKKLGHSGTGLGLAVVWNVLIEHGGFVEVKQPGIGTRFDLHIPSTTARIEQHEEEYSEADLQGKGEHILIIDDEESIRSVASSLLTDLGYKVSEVSSGEEAVAFVKDQAVDLLVLDMIMDPGINGYLTYKEISKLYPGQKAVIASGFSESNDVKRAQALGAGAFIKKPYTGKELGIVVKKELEEAS